MVHDTPAQFAVPTPLPLREDLVAILEKEQQAQRDELVKQERNFRRNIRYIADEPQARNDVESTYEKLHDNIIITAAREIVAHALQNALKEAADEAIRKNTLKHAITLTLKLSYVSLSLAQYLPELSYTATFNLPENLKEVSFSALTKYVLDLFLEKLGITLSQDVKTSLLADLEKSHDTKDLVLTIEKEMVLALEAALMKKSRKIPDLLAVAAGGAIPGMTAAAAATAVPLAESSRNALSNTCDARQPVKTKHGYNSLLHAVFGTYREYTLEGKIQINNSAELRQYVAYVTCKDLIELKTRSRFSPFFIGKMIALATTPATMKRIREMAKTDILDPIEKLTAQLVLDPTSTIDWSTFFSANSENEKLFMALITAYNKLLPEQNTSLSFGDAGLLAEIFGIRLIFSNAKPKPLIFGSKYPYVVTIQYCRCAVDDDHEYEAVTYDHGVRIAVINTINKLIVRYQIEGEAHSQNPTAIAGAVAAAAAEAKAAPTYTSRAPTPSVPFGYDAVRYEMTSPNPGAALQRVPVLRRRKPIAISLSHFNDSSAGYATLLEAPVQFLAPCFDPPLYVAPMLRDFAAASSTIPTSRNPLIFLPGTAPQSPGGAAAAAADEINPLP